MVIDAIRYLVVKQITDPVVVEVLYKYFVDGAPISELAEIYGFTKHQVRGYIYRVMEKAGYTKGRTLLKALYPFLRRLNPVTDVYGGRARCRICGFIAPVQYMSEHIYKSHRELVEDIVQQAVMYISNVLDR